MYTFDVHTQVYQIASLNIYSVRDANTILLEIVHLINVVHLHIHCWLHVCIITFGAPVPLMLDSTARVASTIHTHAHTWGSKCPQICPCPCSHTSYIYIYMPFRCNISRLRIFTTYVYLAFLWMHGH